MHQVSLTATVLVFWCIFTVSLLHSQTRVGVIKGHVIDKVTKEGLPSANIIVKGTYYGAATDFDGNFTIPRVNTGVYVVEIKLLGYKLVQYPALKVVDGQTTTLDIAMEETSLTLGQEVVVVGEKPLFDIEETSSRRSVKSEDIAVAAIQNVEDVVSMQVGVVKSDDQIHIRGGRSYETAYIIDGISVQDPLSGTGFGLELPPNSIQEAEVITGGYNAEFGQATSGVINLTTKDGGDTYTGVISHKQDHFGFNDNSRSNFNTDIYDFSLSGPEPITTTVLPALGLNIPGKISFFINANVNLQDGYTRWVEHINAGGLPDGWELKAPGGLKSGLINQSWLSPRRSNNWSAFTKLTWKISPVIKLAYAGTYSIAVNQNTQNITTTLEYVEPQPGYQYLFQNIPDSANTFAQVSMQQSLTLTHTISNKTFYEVRLSLFHSHLRGDDAGKSWEDYTQPKDLVTFPISYKPKSADTILVVPGDGFYDVGSPNDWRDQNVKEVTVKFDVTSNFDEKNKFKSGIEMRFQNMQMIDIYQPWIKPLGYDNDIYTVQTALGAIYAQDNVNYGGMILNFGLRFDYWFPGQYADSAMDLSNQNSLVSSAIRENYQNDTYTIFHQHWKGRLSPRLAIAHPVSDNQTLFFSYGHFSKFPRPQYVYTKLFRSAARSTAQTIGNPDLNPETTVAYELGLRNQISENDVLTVTAYYKDIFDYITTQALKVPPSRFSSGTYYTYINSDYARARGLELEYNKRYSDWFRSTISTAYQIITEKSTSPEETQFNLQQGIGENVKENYASWDRPFQGTLVLNFRVNKDKPLFDFGKGILDDYNIYLRFFYQSGKRYTPQIFVGYENTTGRALYIDDPNNINGAVGKDVKSFNVNFEKYFTLLRMKLTFTIEIKNLFDWQNAQVINPVTGDAYQPKDSKGQWTATPQSWNDPHYPDIQAPISPYPYNPARFMEPRQILAGLSLAF